MTSSSAISPSNVQLNYKEVRVPEVRLECSDSNKKERLCYRVVDLEPEQEYEIQVAGHNDGAGWGEWSDTLNARTYEQSWSLRSHAI